MATRRDCDLAIVLFEVLLQTSVTLTVYITEVLWVISRCYESVNVELQ